LSLPQPFGTQGVHYLFLRKIDLLALDECLDVERLQWIVGSVDTACGSFDKATEKRKEQNRMAQRKHRKFSGGIIK
jgi:hypothetical protein